MSPSAILALLCVCATVTGARTGSVEEFVDLIELNHFYDAHGAHVYDQVIFYERSPETARFQVRAWCLVEDRDLYTRRPMWNPETKIVAVDWLDNDQRLLRKIKSKQFRESWTQIDPERADKRRLDERYRTALIQYPKKEVLMPNESNQEEKSPHSTQLASNASSESRPLSAQANDIVIAR
jgi:hypothetical protein